MLTDSTLKHTIQRTISFIKLKSFSQCGFVLFAHLKLKNQRNFDSLKHWSNDVERRIIMRENKSFKLITFFFRLPVACESKRIFLPYLNKSLNDFFFIAAVDFSAKNFSVVVWLYALHRVRLFNFPDRSN